MKIISAMVLGSLIVLSCSMKQEIFLEKDGSGKARVQINLKSFVLPTLEDLAEVSPDVDPDEFFSPDKISEAMAENAEITNVTARRISKNRLSINFDFGSIENLFAQTQEDIKNSGLIKIEKIDNKTKLTLTINKETYRGFSKTIPNIEDPAMFALAPDPDVDISEGEYLDMIGFFFGDNGPEGVVDSSLELIINVDGSVVDQEGGRKLSESSVEFAVPLIRLLLLDQDLVYSITYI